jgi:hypothetical protein
MGKGTIIGGGPEGDYGVQINYDQTQLKLQLDFLEKKLAALEAQRAELQKKIQELLCDPEPSEDDKAIEEIENLIAELRQQLLANEKAVEAIKEAITNFESASGGSEPEPIDIEILFKRSLLTEEYTQARKKKLEALGLRSWSVSIDSSSSETDIYVEPQGRELAEEQVAQWERLSDLLEEMSGRDSETVAVNEVVLEEYTKAVEESTTEIEAEQVFIDEVEIQEVEEKDYFEDPEEPFSDPENDEETLTGSASIEGTIKRSSDMAALEGIKVQIYRKEGVGDEVSYSYVTSENTAADGTYTLSGLSEGTYKLKFSDPDGNYLTEYHDDKATLDLANEFTVTAAESVTGKDAVLGTAASVSGTVTSAA